MKKRGFTLVELLAVIVILAIIALIATPIILNVIKDAKYESANRSLEGYLDAIEKSLLENELEDEKIEIQNDGCYDVETINKYISIKGNKPTEGEVCIENKKILSAVKIKIDGYELSYSGGKIIEEYTEEILNGADPIIKGNLVAVTIEDDGTVKKADELKKWYSYENKKWANAVILKENKNYKIGETIKEENIKQYYVWIPRYSYKLWNVNSNNTENVGKPIEIKFGSEAKTEGTNNGNHYIHPAFTNFNTNGIWVGKYEISYDEETYTNSSKFLTTNPNTSSATESSKIIIKPNVRSLTNKNVSSLYTLIRGIDSSLNSHMMTNMEWGATAYLTYSKYGRCNETTCSEVTINNVNTGYYGSSAVFTGQWQYGTTITGCAADSVSASLVSNVSSCTNKYNTSKGYLASTTGNISGIYDMSGGTWEYVMGVIADENGKAYSGRNSFYESGFKGKYGCPTCDGNTSGLTENTTGKDFPSDARYYDLYRANSNVLADDTWYKYDNGKLGDATKEIANTKANASIGDRGLWYSDYAYFATPTYPWVIRGGSWSHGTGAGFFNFRRSGGRADGYNSARSVLAY